jgi:hypothetical protein
MKRFLPLVLVLAAVVLPGMAHAATTPCRDRIYNDWYSDGKIATTYPISCYRDALANVPGDARIYSSLLTDIRAAMQAALARERGATVPNQIGKGFGRGKGRVLGAAVALGPSSADHGRITGVADAATGAPLPILVLGGFALALAGAGAIGTGVRFARNRNRR